MKKFNTRDMPLHAMRTLLLIGLMSLVAACSSIRLSYNHGETLLYWWLDAYVDLASDQKIPVKKDIAALFQWHRQTQLKEYVQVLVTGQRQLQGTVTAVDLLSDYSDIKNHTQLLLSKSLPELANLARSLRPEQIAQITKKFVSNNQEYRKKNMQPEVAKRQKARFEKSLEQFELWFGSFSREQEEAIRAASYAIPLNNELWLEERMQRQQTIINLVQQVQREKLSQDATMALISKVIKSSFEHRDHKPFFDAFTDATAQMVVTVIKLATPAQKAHAQQRMQGWIDDLNSLAAETN